jgi:hypothetical protein
VNGDTIIRAVWFMICHPLLDLVAGLIILDYLNLSWPGLAGTATVIILMLVVLRLVWPQLFTRFVAAPVRDG